MGILSLFRAVRRKDRNVAAAVVSTEKKSVPATVGEVSLTPPSSLTPRAMPVLQGPVITEKSTRLSVEHQYVFRVDARATKPMIRSAVERAYNVHVEHVNLVQLPSKLRRRGRVVGVVPGTRKAVVALRSGEHIDTSSGTVDHVHTHA